MNLRYCMLAFLLSVTAVLAHGPELKSSSPIAVSRATETTLHLHGKRLSKAQGILFYRTGIRAGEPTIVSPEHVSFPLFIAADCPLGEHPLRLHCADGVTYQRTLHVSPYPISYETKSSNNDASSAQATPVNHCIIGTSTLEDIDYFKISLKKGQRFSSEVFAMRLGRLFFDAHLSFLDSNLKLLASSDDTPLTKQDPYISVITPADGDYYLAVREASYEGSNNSRYLLYLSDSPRPAAIFPPSARLGETTEFTLLHSDGSSQKSSATVQDSLLYSGSAKFPSASPNPLHLSEFPTVSEKEPNSSAKECPSAVKIPHTFQGSIQSPNDTDWFSFHASKGQHIRIAAHARSLGSGLDPRLVLRDAKGKYIQANDDAGQIDSRIDFSVPATGDYFISIRDHLGKGAPHFTYCIDIELRKPTVSASLNRVDRRDSQKYKVINIPRGSRLAYRLNLTRERNAASFIPHAENLPTGVTLQPVSADKKLNSIPLYFEASVDAPLSAGLYPITLQSSEPALSCPITETIEHIFVNNQGIYHSTHSDKLAICVTDPAPFSIEITQPTVAAVPNGSLELIVTAKREKGFDAAINLFFPYLPPTITAANKVTIGKGQMTTRYRLSIKPDSPLKEWQLCLSATANTKDGPTHLSSNLIKVAVKEPYLQAKLEIAATTQGEHMSIPCKIAQATPFEGKATLTLQGLPDGITAEPVHFTHTTREVLIPVKVSSNARTGKHSNLFCHIQVPDGAQFIPHNSAHGGSLRIDKSAPQATPKKAPLVAKKNPTRPLSRLQQLRLEQQKRNGK